MKVLFLAHSFPRTPEDPVGSFVLRLGAALRPLGVEVLVAAPAAPGLPPHDTFEGVDVVRFRYAPRRFETLAYSGTMRHQVKGSWVGRAAMLAFLAGSFWNGLGTHWLAEGVTALVPDVRPVVAPMPVLPGLFTPPAPGSRRRDRLLFVGKLNEQKGIGVLLQALARMRAKPVLDVVVGVGSTPEDARPLAESLDVAGRVEWHPLLSQAELAQRYREATALVAPFRDEGLGLVAIEAQLSGAPVVAFRSGGLTDIVAHQQTGLLVPPGDAPALAAALDRLLALPDQGEAWGREGRRRALATFAPEATARRYLEIYRETLGLRDP